MENLSLSKIGSILKKNTKLITLCSVAGLSVGILYSVTLFKPVYKSDAKLLIKDYQQEAIVTDLNTPNRITPLTRDGNPTLTQMQILASTDLARQVWDQVSAKYGLTQTTAKGIKTMQKSIEVQNPVGTDIIEVTASWDNPQIAKDIADGFVTAYINSNVDLAKKGATQNKESITDEYNRSVAALNNVRAQIKEFRQQNATVNLDVESADIVQQISNLENRYNEIASNANAESNKVKSIASRLGIDWHKAVGSVALGYNQNITALQTRLGQAQEDLASFNTKYSPTHPTMMALNSKISQIKTELGDQIKQTVGPSSANETNGVMISDPVRTNMMEQLVNSEANYRGFVAQSSRLKSAIGGLKARKADIPNKQLILADLLQQEANLANVVNVLKTKQIEAGIRESEIVSNISVVESPAAPLAPAFPGRIPVALLFGLLGALFGMSSSIGMYMTKGTCDDLEQVEENVNAPVLGMIPWLDKQTYNEPDALLAIDNTASFYALAYQKVVSSLRIRSSANNAKALAFTSSEFTKFRSTVLMNIAYSLNKSGQSVVIVDSDFRTPSIHNEFGLNATEAYDLTKLLNDINIAAARDIDYDWRQLNNFVKDVHGTHDLHVITNNGNVSDPYEFLHSTAYDQLITALKARYDWVLVDTPPVLAVTDALVVGSHVDGVILMSGLNVSKKMLNKISKAFNEYNMPLFGVIAREFQTEEAVSSNKYLKQMISRMMPNKSDELIRK